MAFDDNCASDLSVQRLDASNRSLKRDVGLYRAVVIVMRVSLLQL